MTLEQLAEKHCNTFEEYADTTDGGVEAVDMYHFTIDQLDAYFMERLKMVVGEPVAHYDESDAMLTYPGFYRNERDLVRDGRIKPLHALSVSLED